MKKEKIAVIGGYGGTGRFFASFFANEGFDVTVTGPDERKGRKAAEELGVKYERDNKKAAKKADVVMVAVPIHATLEVIEEVASEVKPGSLLMDVTSVKEGPCKAMAENAAKDVEVIGTHPMFSHRVGGIEGQVVILAPVRGKRWLPWLKKLMEEKKARVYETTPREHDKMMAVVQGLTHFSYIAVGKTLQELDFDIKESRKYSSPVYELMLDMIGRILGQNPELYAEIQMMNPQTLKVHERFIETAEALSNAVKEKNESEFVKTMAEAAKHFGDVERSMGRSDKAIASLVSELAQLKESMGEEICVKHIYSGQTHLGAVKSVDPEDVVLEDNGKESRLKLANIRVLGKEEKTECIKERYGIVSRDYSVVFCEGVDEKLIASLLAGFDENITKVDIKDVYSGPQVGEGRKSACFSVEMINRGAKETEKGIDSFFAGLGGVRR